MVARGNQRNKDRSISGTNSDGKVASGVIMHPAALVPSSPVSHEGAVGEQDLLTQAAIGDQSAIYGLMDRYGPPLQGFVLWLVGDRELAQDIVCAAFRQAGPQLVHARLRTSLKVRLYRIARDLVRERLGQCPPVLAAELRYGPPDNRLDLRGSLPAWMRQAMAELSVSDQEALELRFFHQFSEAELAAILGVSTLLAKHRLRNALQHLTGRLRDSGVTVGDLATCTP